MTDAVLFPQSEAESSSLSEEENELLSSLPRCPLSHEVISHDVDVKQWLDDEAGFTQSYRKDRLRAKLNVLPEQIRRCGPYCQHDDVVHTFYIVDTLYVARVHGFGKRIFGDLCKHEFWCVFIYVHFQDYHRVCL